MAQVFSSPSSYVNAVRPLLQAGRWSEAERILRPLADQGDGDACSLLGQVYVHLRRGADAEACFRKALAQGESVSRLQNLAGLSPARGAVTEARQLYARALALAPENAVLHCALGRLLFPHGEKKTALAELKKAVACDPAYAPAQLYLGVALLDFGDVAAARAPLNLAQKMLPDDPLAQYHYGIVCQKSGDLPGAIAAYKAAIALRPGYLLALERLGQCYIASNIPDQALVYFQRYLTYRPDAAAAHYGCGMALVRLGKGGESVAEFRKAVAADFPGAKVALAGALHASGESAAACAMFEALCRAEPENARAALGLADTQQALGHLDAAYNAYLRAIVLDPESPAYYRRLLSLGESYPLPEPQQHALLALAGKADTMSLNTRGELYFAMYHFYVREKKYDAAINALLAANAAKRALAVYNEADELQYMKAIVAATPAKLLAEKVRFGNRSDLPVFIVGMPRSGTTLTEQILASHPDVYGAGEISDFGLALAKVCGHADVVDLAALSGEQMRAVASEYLDRLQSYAPRAKRVVDKLPWNFRLVGYIHALLPGAQILHTHRNAMDTCFSCFEQDLRSNVPFCGNLTELGHYYRGYEAMMAHWREVLPEGEMLEVEYETLVTHFEAEVHRILAFCHLPWNSACLKFYQGGRTVRTASAAQVRQPIYQSSVGRWKRYAAALAPLQQALSL